MGRPDPAMNMFRTQNFLPLLLPQQGILPLQLVGVYGKNLCPLGEMTTSLVAPRDVQVPPIVPDIATGASFEGKSSAPVKLSIGLEILGNLLKALTGKDLNLTAAYSKAKTVTFKFTDVSADKVEINRLDQYLGRASIHPDSRHIERMMIDDQVGVLTMTLKSKKFIITAQHEEGKDLNVSVPMIHGLVGGSVEVQSQDASSAEIAYEGTVPVTFATQGVQLFFDDAGNYTAFDPFRAGQHAVRGGARHERSTRGFEPRMLTAEGGFARIVAAKEE